MVNYPGRESLEGLDAKQLGRLPAELSFLAVGAGGTASMGAGSARGGGFSSTPQAEGREAGTGQGSGAAPTPLALIAALAGTGDYWQGLGTVAVVPPLTRALVCVGCNRTICVDQSSSAFQGLCEGGCVACHRKCLGSAPNGQLIPFAQAPGTTNARGDAVLSHELLRLWMPVVNGEGLVQVYMSGGGV